VTAAHFFTEDVSAETIRITGADAHHAARALRIRPSEEITVSDGRGTVVRARCTDASPSSLTADVISRTYVEQPTPTVVVYPALPKAGKLETIVQKLTELGVDEIRPWFAARSVVKWDAKKSSERTDRLRAVAREAAMQSRRAYLPLVEQPQKLEELADLTVVLDEEATDPLSSVLPAVGPQRVGIVVGPEGGLTRDEVDSLASAGAVAATLGPHVLRTETAAIVGPALVLARFGRLG
jgi:16S rRNA (uracil1498-N3)-methyltransferase